MPYRVQTNDDGTLSIVTDGDCIAHSDSNHETGDKQDARDFEIMCAALNLVEATRAVVQLWFGLQAEAAAPIKKRGR
jgi:hypothetical protein